MKSFLRESDPIPLGRIALLLFGSGLCSLIFQTIWLREFRLLFGTSTLAISAVVAIFMGGLGFGALLLGKRAERHPNPLRLYAFLEALIAAWVILYPVLMAGAHDLYLALGGTLALGDGLGTMIRLVLATLVIGPPAFLMGGTLAAAAEAVEIAGDPTRTRVALLYGANTLGAFAGVNLATFLLLEALGGRGTLWLACAIDLLISGAAWKLSHGPAWESARLAREGPRQEGIPPGLSQGAPHQGGDLDRWGRSTIFAGLALSGATFFMMEVVWYRLLVPILGGTTYTFGVVLGVVLLGIGTGGFLYSIWGMFGKPTFSVLACVSALELLGVAVPFALGDRLAALALLLKSLDCLGFPLKVANWYLIAGVMILPAAVMAGFQFPLLIGLLGKGQHGVGSQIGGGFAVNTLGAIFGSIAGGFFILPHFSTLGCWKIAALGMMFTSLLATWVSFLGRRRIGALALPTLLCFGGLLAFHAEGPTGFWRNGGIAAWNQPMPLLMSSNQLKGLIREKRQAILWERDGRETSLALFSGDGLAFAVNGKIDGNAILNAPTQVGLGLLAAFLHPHPRTALVIGLGTGSSGGWLTRVKTIERVEVVELEPAMVEVASWCSAVNAGILENPKAHIVFNDAREHLLTNQRTWDLIVSEPSNPHLVGVGSLFTREFYQAIDRSLNPEGFFCQWIQAYAIDPTTFDSILGTLVSVFPNVSIWRTATFDLVFICSRDLKRHSVPALRRRLREEPFRSAFEYCWRAGDLEGILARRIGNPQSVREYLASLTFELNTDDRMLVESGFARSVGKTTESPIGRFLKGRNVTEDLQNYRDGPIDPERIREFRCQIEPLEEVKHRFGPEDSAALIPRMVLYEQFTQGRMSGVRELCREVGAKAVSSFDLCVIAEGLAFAGDPATADWLARLEPLFPGEAAAIRARWLLVREEHGLALEELCRALRHFQADPWSNPTLVGRTIDLAGELAVAIPAAAPRLCTYLLEPFCEYSNDDRRLNALLRVARNLPPELTAEVLHQFEPGTPWRLEFLTLRRDCYRAVRDPLAQKAADELQEFCREAGLPLETAGKPLPPGG